MSDEDDSVEKENKNETEEKEETNLIKLNSNKIIEKKEKIKELEENTNQDQTDLIEDDEKISIYKLISSIFDDKSKKSKIIERLRPYFSLKVVPQREIDKVYSAVEKIEPEKIDFVEEFKYEEEKFDSKNKFETNSKSIGLSSNDLDLSVNIFNFKSTLNYNNSEENSNSYSKNSSKIHCIHSIVISLFRIVIDYKDIKLAKQVNEDLKDVENSNATEKKLLLEKFVQKFGLYIPLELIVGGRINISFEANNEEEKTLLHQNLQREIKANLEGGIKWIKTDFKGKFNSKNKNSNENNSLNLDKLENASIKMIGGDYLYKDDLKKWIKSFNINNLQVIEYKTLIPIYCFIPGLEKKLKICLNDYEDIVFQEIFNLLESKYKIEEKNIYEGISTNNNSWSVGIIKNNYQCFDIYQKKIVKSLYIDKLSLKKETISKEDVICGEIPEGYIICGWIISTNANSKPNNLICSWERSKELGILGSRYFKFKVSASSEKEIDENGVEINWTVQVFCLNSDYNNGKIKFFEGESKNKNNNINNDPIIPYIVSQYPGAGIGACISYGNLFGKK